MAYKTCDYDEEYIRQDALKLGWCSKCGCGNCSYNKRKATNKDMIFDNKQYTKLNGGFLNAHDQV